LVEDDQVDAMTVERAIHDLNIGNTLIHVSNGEQALDYLMAPQSPMPCLILLDLNMPRMNGIEFLDAIHHDDRLKLIPVIVLTSSEDEQDKLKSFRMGIAGYMLKPVDYKQFVDVIRTIDIFWTVSEFPPLD